MDFKIALFKNDISSFNIPYILVDNSPYFKGKDIANVLGYANTTQAIRINVDDDDKQKLEDLTNQLESLGELSNSCLDYNERNAIYINEGGLYSLILKSEKQEAKIFKKWITSELLPTIRSTGSYTIPKTIKNQIILKNETDLHYKVIDFIRSNYPEIMIVPGLGENQRTPEIRTDSWKKGYTAGQPDIIIVAANKMYNGLAIELKTPVGIGILSTKQQAYLTHLRRQNYKIMVSNNYDLILMQLIEYFRDIRIHCEHCVKKFKNESTLATHKRIFHRITNPEL